jgi:hypothetical protein
LASVDGVSRIPIMFRRVGGALCIIAGGITSLVSAGAARSAELDREVEFHIAAQRLDSALLEYSTQAHVQLAVAAKTVGELRTGGLNGRLTAGAALTVLLRDTGLVYTAVGHTVTVGPARAMHSVSPRRDSARNEMGGKLERNAAAVTRAAHARSAHD